MRMGLDKFPWAERYGWTTDQYGVEWQLIWQANPALVVGVTLPALAAASMILLPRVKGAVIGVHWAVDTRRGPQARDPM